MKKKGEAGLRQERIAKQKREAYLRKQGRSLLQNELVAHGQQALKIMREVWAGKPIDKEHEKAKIILQYITKLNNTRGVMDEVHMDTLGFDFAALKREKDAKLVLIEKPTSDPTRNK